MICSEVVKCLLSQLAFQKQAAALCGAVGWAGLSQALDVLRATFLLQLSPALPDMRAGQCCPLFQRVPQVFQCGHQGHHHRRHDARNYLSPSMLRDKLCQALWHLTRMSAAARKCSECLWIRSAVPLGGGQRGLLRSLSLLLC